MLPRYPSEAGAVPASEWSVTKCFFGDKSELTCVEIPPEAESSGSGSAMVFFKIINLRGKCVALIIVLYL
jgi:hypothetical protein